MVQGQGGPLMGTSSSSNGPGSNSPLVPPWADSDPDAPLPEPESQRFREFRTNLGKFVSGGGVDGERLRTALGSYARKATGGGGVASRRYGAMAASGGALFDAMAALRDGRDPNLPGVDLDTLVGRPTRVFIDMLVNALVPPNGDADCIRVALNDALSEALEGQAEFDFDNITDDIIADTMIAYLTECIYEQVMLDSNDAFAKATDPAQYERAEKAMRNLIRAAVDKYLAPLLTGNVRTLNGRMVRDVQQRAIRAIWAEWEAYGQ